MGTGTKKQMEVSQSPERTEQRPTQSSSTAPEANQRHHFGRVPRTPYPRGWNDNRALGESNSNGSKSKKLAIGLGWFSVGLGLAEILAPRKVANFVGVRRSNSSLIRLFGFREIASGISIFAQRKRPSGAVWSRVAGDALDLAALGAALASTRSNKGKLAFAAANVLAVGTLDVLCAKQLSNGRNGRSAPNLALKSIIINRPPEELYREWRNFENLPRFLNTLKSVQTTGPSHSHWVANGPAGAKVEWDAEITLDRPNERIEWHSLSGADIDHYGSIHFERAAGDRGTIVHVELHYRLPGGKFGSALGKLFGQDPGQRAMNALRRFKQVMETGEVVVSEGTLHHNGFLTQRPAQAAGDSQSQGSQSLDNSRRSIPRRSTQRSEEGYAS